MGIFRKNAREVAVSNPACYPEREAEKQIWKLRPGVREFHNNALVLQGAIEDGDYRSSWVGNTVGAMGILSLMAETVRLCAPQTLPAWTYEFSSWGVGLAATYFVGQSILERLLAVRTARDAELAGLAIMAAERIQGRSVADVPESESGIVIPRRLEKAHRRLSRYCASQPA